MFSLADLLELPLLRSARPNVLTGERFDTRPVRWVHTSEIFDIAPLLKGQEVLFTTGLGLVGASDTGIDSYISSLTSQGVTALVMEVGRTFVHLPEQFVTSAHAHDLPLIVLRQMIPFVEITETVHPLLISKENAELRKREEAYNLLTSEMLSGNGVNELVRVTERLCATSVGLYSHGGQLLAGEDVRSAGGEPMELSVGPDPWGMLVVAAPEGSSAAGIAEIGARVAALRLAQDITGSPSRALAVSDLLADIAQGRFLRSEEVDARAAALGFVVNPQRRLVPLIVELTRAARGGHIAVSSVARRQFGANLVGELDDRIVVVAQIRSELSLESQLQTFTDALEHELDGEGQLVRIVVGPIADQLAGLAISIPQAIEGAKLAKQLTFSAKMLTSRDLGLYNILARAVPDTELEVFVEQQLGPLLQADARSGNRLMATLSIYLESGRSKSVAAAKLNISRQTMYQRLERIVALLGDIDIDAHSHLVSLDLAVAAWRLRTSSLTRPQDA